MSDSGVTFRNERFNVAFRCLLWTSIATGIVSLVLPNAAKGMVQFLTLCLALAAIYIRWWCENSRVTVSTTGLTATNYDGQRRTVPWDEILSVSPLGRVETVQKMHYKYFIPRGNDLFVPAGILESAEFQREVRAVAKPCDAFVRVFKTPS